MLVLHMHVADKFCYSRCLSCQVQLLLEPATLCMIMISWTLPKGRKAQLRESSRLAGASCAKTLQNRRQNSLVSSPSEELLSYSLRLQLASWW